MKYRFISRYWDFGMTSQRSQVIQLYKTVIFKINISNIASVILIYFNSNLQLQYLGREYPGGADKFRKKCHDIFIHNSKEVNPEKIETMIEHGKFVVKELEALYSLRKYRAMKKRYYEDE